jgi:hypothetical protein
MQQQENRPNQAVSHRPMQRQKNRRNQTRNGCPTQPQHKAKENHSKPRRGTQNPDNLSDTLKCSHLKK